MASPQPSRRDSPAARSRGRASRPLATGLVLLAGVLLAAPRLAPAAELDASASELVAATPPLPPPALDAGALQAHLDAVVPALMRERHLPGAVVVAVQRGQVVISRGYGVADLRTGRPVDPETTLFRVASVSKLFTATALMQLVEEGKIDLDDDVERWIEGFHLAPSFGDPVRVWNLLTHTAGFDDSFLGSTQRLSDAPIALASHLARHMPPRVMPPGRWISYSNYGLALAGHLVERASGETFSARVQRRIFDPLGMQRSRFGLPAEAPPELAQGYEWTGKGWRAEPPDRMHMAPAGDLVTTGNDVARFMIAHLQRGRFGDARILAPETADVMHARRFANHPALDGWCLGFMERRLGGVRTIGHGGSWRGFGTELVLVPERDFGLFVSTTRANDPRFFDGLMRSVFDRFFPADAPAPPPLALDRAQLARWTGSWLPNRHVRGDFLKLGLLESELVTELDDDGVLVARPRELDPMRLHPIEPGVFAVEGTNRRVAFREDEHGRPVQLYADQWAFDRAGPLDRPGTHVLAGALCVVLFAGTLLGFGLGGLSRALAGGPPSSVPLGARLLVCGVSALDLAVILGVGSALASTSPFDLFHGVPGWLAVLGLVPFVSVPLSLAVPWALRRSRHAARTGSHAFAPLARLHFLVLTLALAVFAWLVVHWRLFAIQDPT